MILEKIKVEDLLFSGEIEDDRTNTYFRLSDEVLDVRVIKSILPINEK